MNKSGNRQMLSGRSLKLVGGVVSVFVLALLALLAVGFFSDNQSAPTTTQRAPITPSQEVSQSESTLDGGEALHAAIEKMDIEAVHVLIKAGVYVNAKDRFGDPALHVAIAKGDPELVRILVEAGANVDSKNAFGDPCLHRAILNGDIEMVRILVEAGANVGATNAFGDSALTSAVNKGNREILQILAEAAES